MHELKLEKCSNIGKDKSVTSHFDSAGTSNLEGILSYLSCHPFKGRDYW